MGRKSFLICSNQDQPRYISFFVEPLPVEGPDFPQRLAEALRFTSVELLCKVADQQLNAMLLAPVVGLNLAEQQYGIYAGAVASVAVLGRTSAGLFLRRRPLVLHREWMEQRYLIHREEISVSGMFDE